MAKFNYYIKGTNEKVRTSANIYTPGAARPYFCIRNK